MCIARTCAPAVVAQARNDGWSFLTGVLYGTFTVPGDGAIDFDAVLAALHGAGYEGWLVVEAEQDPAVAPSYAYAEQGIPDPARHRRSAGPARLRGGLTWSAALQVKAAPTGRDIVDVTPQSAGWEHVGFRAIRLAAGETETIDTGTRELCLVVLTGSVDVSVGKQAWPGLGTRDSVFDDVRAGRHLCAAGPVR